MAAKNGLTTASQIAIQAREVDFVTRFGKNWEVLRDILGIMRPIRKTPGTKLAAYEAVIDNYVKTSDRSIIPGKTYYIEEDGNYTPVAAPVPGQIGLYFERALAGGEVGEGEEIPYTKTKVVPKAFADLSIEKYAKAVSIEAVEKYGAKIAVQKTDEAFLNELQNKVLVDFYGFLKTGSLTKTETTWQRALALAKGAVLNKFASMSRNVTKVVGFANIMDLYGWLGDKDITVQTAFGLQYIKNFLGYDTLFLLPANYIAVGQVIATPAENIDLYYIDPGDSDFAQLGLNYRVQGETNLIGFHAQGDYSHAVGESFALMGMKLWAEYLDGIAVYTVSP